MYPEARYLYFPPLPRYDGHAIRTWLRRNGVMGGITARTIRDGTTFDWETKRYGMVPLAGWLTVEPSQFAKVVKLLEQHGAGEHPLCVGPEQTRAQLADTLQKAFARALKQPD